MCARFTLVTDAEKIQEHFEIKAEVPELPLRYNVAPTDVMPIVRLSEYGEERILERYRWGLIPPWAKDPKAGAQMINARSESVFDRPSYRFAIRQQRCLIPADGYYEWQVVEEVSTLGGLFGEEAAPAKKKRKPRYIRYGNGLFAFAGIYDVHPEFGPSFSVLTCVPNEVLSSVHSRMPVILRPEDYATWLNPNSKDTDLRKLMAPVPSEGITMNWANPKVGNVQNDSPDMLSD
jgi:putative SOS response-associated peptidase YedK